MMRKIFYSLAIVSILSICITDASVLWGQESPHGRRPMIGDDKQLAQGSPHSESSSLLTLKKALKLSEEQEEQMKALRFEYEKGRIQREADIRVAEIELLQLLEQCYSREISTSNPTETAECRELVNVLA